MRNSFEGASLQSAEIDHFHEKALKVMEADQIQETAFIEPYGEDTISRDVQKVVELEAKFLERETPQSKEQKKVADIFEAIILWNGEQSDWFGPNAMTMKTSRFDDYVNGVDAIVEFQGNEVGTASYVGLATDITFSTDTTTKFDRLRGQIDRGELAKVKYFHSEHMSMHGQLSNLPEVVVGADRKMVLELAEMWAEKRFQELAEHRMQIMMLLQIQEQLITFAQYAESIQRADIADVFRSRLKIIEGILNDKKDIVLKTKYDINDDVHSGIMSYLARWQKDMRERVQV